MKTNWPGTTFVAAKSTAPRQKVMWRGARNGERGFLLVTVLLVTVVIGILVIGASTTSLIDRQVASRQRGGTEAYYMAQAGLDRLKTTLFLALSDLEASGEQFCGPPDFDLDIGGGVVLSPALFSEPIPDFGGSGFYQLRFDRTQNFYVITSVGWLGTTEDRVAQATMQLVATAGVAPFGAWDNAIFTEELTAATPSGQAGRIAAYGSVHVVNGEVVLDDDVAVAYTGTAGIFNNYNGKLNGVQTNVVQQATRALGTSRAHPYDLCSRLKVEQGNVHVGSGAGGIGAEGDEYDGDEWIGPCTSYAECQGQIQSIEGVYLGQGELTRQPQGTPIYSRSGVVNHADEEGGYRSLHLPFPVLPDGFPFEEGGPNQAVLDDSNCDLVVDDGNGGTVLLLPPAEPPDPGDVPVVCGDGVNALVWDEVARQVTVTGSIAIPEATLSIQPRGDINELSFDGVGQFRIGEKSEAGSTGRIEIGMSVVPVNGENNYRIDDDGQPVTGSSGLAMITSGDLVIDVEGEDGTVAALFYAEGSADLRKQVAIVGSVVGGNVHVQQVPRVLWHEDIVAMAEFMCLVGSVCDLGGPGYQGQWAEVSTEIR
jgi:type II secretory pathway pseudopilin PulG